MEAGDFADITDAWPVLYEMDIWNGIISGAGGEQPRPENRGLSYDLPPLRPGEF